MSAQSCVALSTYTRPPPVPKAWRDIYLGAVEAVFAIEPTDLRTSDPLATTVRLAIIAGPLTMAA